MSSANIFIGAERCGFLTLNKMQISFQYDDQWKRNGYAISISIPLSGEFTQEVAHNFFSNLLPEGNIRDLVCKKLKISPENDWELLLAIGKESAGALTISEVEKEFVKNYRNYGILEQVSLFINKKINKTLKSI